MNDIAENNKGQEPLMLYAAIFGAAFLIMLMSWSSYSSRDEVDLRRAEIEVLSRFSEVTRHGGVAIRLPNLGVLGPNGDVVKIHENRTKYTVLSLWAYDGQNTKQQLAGLKALHDRMAKQTDWQILAVSVDHVNDLDKTYSFIADLESREIAEYHDYEAVLLEYFELSKADLPVTFLLDNRNRIIYELRGDANWGDSDMADFLETVTLNF